MDAVYATILQQIMLAQVWMQLNLQVRQYLRKIKIVLAAQVQILPSPLFVFNNHIFTLLLTGKMLILSYKTIFGPTYCNLKKMVKQFFRKFPTTVICAIFWHFWPKFGQNENFSQKSVHAIFLPSLSPNFMPSLRKIVRAVYQMTYSLHTYGQG